jgi:hypothetical protein
MAEAALVPTVQGRIRAPPGRGRDATRWGCTRAYGTPWSPLPPALQSGKREAVRVYGEDDGDLTLSSPLESIFSEYMNTRCPVAAVSRCRASSP